jgi:Mn2+/Fe2+ NRAMP family transporter
MGADSPAITKSFRRLRAMAVWGPGLLVMLADTDAGNVVTAAQGGAEWGYRLLPLTLILIPPLYLMQELTVRLGIFTGRGHGELIRQRFGTRWAWLSAGGLTAATIGSLVTEFTAVAGIGDLYGLPRSLTLPAAAIFLLVVVATGSYRRVERTAIVIGLFELAFFAVAWKAHPNLESMAGQFGLAPFGDRGFWYLAAALVGAAFNPWMVFYQQSAVVDKKLTADDYRTARLDTATGALLTQGLTAAVLVSAAATLGSAQAPLDSIGDISRALTAVLGDQVGRLIFTAGVLGAAMVAAIVSSLALAWGIGEVAGYQRSLEYRPLNAGWFYGVYALCVVGSAAVVWQVDDLVWLNIAAQVLNAFLMPLVLGFLIALAMTMLPQAHRLRGWHLWAVGGAYVAICAIGLFGGVGGIF